jgi:hypothetical protein
LRNYLSIYSYILGYRLFLFPSFFLNLESSLIYDILPPEPYLLVAFYLQGRDRIRTWSGGERRLFGWGFEALVKKLNLFLPPAN